MSPTALRGGGTVRTGVVLLAVVGFTLSYDALRQMAVAAHIRGVLTYLFPLVIDGFIALGVIALIVLRTAPLRSRLYVWTLVGLATITSIWANALHAVRLNERTRLHLDNATVGALSAIAPLALAGAVHLHLVINRHLSAERTDEETRPVDVAAAPWNVANVAPEIADEPTPVSENPPTAGEESTPVDHELLALARTAPRGRGGKASRRHIEETVRGTGRSISKDDAERVKDALQAELDGATVQEQSAQDPVLVT
ncbi:DUF2637 domain-containing protein [Streptomyces xanthii]|uniref:DUF2637 domain-containing protein n=1 Tax=Streptomyces xanthii TaxID=2768069 RepID=A0A7H1BJB6_9ACTN|nr:DUF2637 domain-containing protein [Streptomyces xanthii]